MNTARSSRRTGLADTIRTYASSPCWMHEVDPGYLGYWSRDEVVAFLESLLERERIGTKALSNIRQAATLRSADLILEFELAQASICLLLQAEIAARGSSGTDPLKDVSNNGGTQSGLEDAIAAARANQAGLSQTIEQAIPNILDSELSSHLTKMMQLHWTQMEKLGSLLT